MVAWAYQWLASGTEHPAQVGHGYAGHILLVRVRSPLGPLQPLLSFADAVSVRFERCGPTLTSARRSSVEPNHQMASAHLAEP